MSTRFLLISLALHLSLGIGLNFPRKKSHGVTSAPIEFELKQVDYQTGGIRQSSLGRLKPTQNKSSKLKDFLFPSTREVIEQALKSKSSADQRNRWSDVETYRSNPFQGNGLGKEQARFVNSLWTEINESIWESPFLSEYGHVGEVFLNFEITAEGKLKEESLRVKAQDRILQVVAIRAVRNALKDENKELVFSKKEMQINARFTWKSFEDCPLFRGIQKNSLSFCKFGENKKKTFTKAEKTRAYLSAVWYGPGMVEEIQKYNREEDRRKNQFDPFEQLRRDPDYNI